MTAETRDPKDGVPTVVVIPPRNEDGTCSDECTFTQTHIGRWCAANHEARHRSVGGDIQPGPSCPLNQKQDKRPIQTIPPKDDGTCDKRCPCYDVCRRSNDVSELAKTAGLVFQNPENQLVTLNVEKELAFGPENLGVEPSEVRRRVEEIIDLLDLHSIREKHPHEMSGGE